MNQQRNSEILKCEIEGKEKVEELFNLVGKYIYIKGMERIIEDSFKIGQGSFAKIYLIRTIYGKTFAVKTFDKKTIHQKIKNHQVFLNELKIMSILSSPYLLSSEYVFQSQKYYYAKIEYFKKSFKNKLLLKLSRRQQKKILKQLLEGLKQMKKHNIIHRDLKPQNIMIREKSNGQQQCVIIDFGLATVSTKIPYLYTRCGTPGFLSPQIANLVNKNEKQSTSADIFSLGCIFYKVITGYYLFSGNSVGEILVNNRKLNYTTHYFSKMEMNERDLLQRMLEKDPQYRITPQGALQHPYFNKQIDDQDEIAEEQHQLSSKMKKLNNKYIIKNMESLGSTTLTMQENSLFQNTGNSVSTSPLKMGKIKDSCATFEFQVKEQSNKENDDFSIKFSRIKEHINQKEKDIKVTKTIKTSNFKPLKIIMNNNDK